MPTHGLPQHHSTCKGINSTKTPVETEPVSKHFMGPQCCSTLILSGLTKAQSLGGLNPQCWVTLCGAGSGWQHNPQGAPFQLGQPFDPEETWEAWPWEPPAQHSSQTCSILWCSSSEEQTRAHSTLCRQEAREKDRYVLLGTSQAGAAPALQDPVDAPPARCHLHSTRPPHRFLGASLVSLPSARVCGQ